MNLSTRFAVCLGVLAGSLAISTAVKADIAVTGGRATGQAAFFTPGTLPAGSTTGGTSSTSTASGSPILFDVGIQTLRIETPNGTTTTSRFTPTAANFRDVNNNRLPDSGDTGRLSGFLSGVAFGSTGNPVFFQGVPTNLDFTLTAFSPGFIQGGTLISPRTAGTAPEVFLPFAPVTLSSQSQNSFTAQQGLLSAGPFAANLTGDFIGLPSNLQFRPSGDVTIPPIELGRRIKFEFKGQNVSLDGATFFNNTVEYEGRTTNFQVQSVGTPGTQEFKIEGTTADIFFRLGSPVTVTRNELNLNTTFGNGSYEVKGEGPGYVTLGNNYVGFTGTSRRATQFKFEQNSRVFEGRSNGDVYFNLGAVSSLGNFTPVTNVNNNGTTYVSNPTFINNTFVSIINSTSTTTIGGASPFSLLVINPNVTFIPVFNPGDLADDDDDDDNNDDDNNTSVDVVQGNLVYTIYQPGPRIVVVERDDDGRILFVERRRDNNDDDDDDDNDDNNGRGRARGRQGRVVAAYQEVGLPSRIFPGLVGLRQIPASELNNSTGGTTTDGTTTPGTTDGTTTPGTTTPGTTTPGTTDGTTTPGTTTPGTTTPGTTTPGTTTP